MGYMCTCKYCHRSYDLDNGYDTDFHSFDCFQKYMAEEKAAQEAEQNRLEREEERHREAESARQERFEARQEEARRRHEEEEERREELREERDQRRSDKLERKQKFLMAACLEGNLDEVKETLREGSLDVDFNSDGKTPLVASLRKGKYEIARCLLSYGNADPNYLQGGLSPLVFCLLDDNTKGIEVLRTSASFRYGPLTKNQVIWLFNAMTLPKNGIPKDKVIATFHDKQLFPDQLREGLEGQLLKDETDIERLLEYVPADFVKEALGVDIVAIKAKIAAEKERAAAEKERAEAELQRKREEEAKAAELARQRAAEAQRESDEADARARADWNRKRRPVKIAVTVLLPLSTLAVLYATYFLNSVQLHYGFFNFIMCVAGFTAAGVMATMASYKNEYWTNKIVLRFALEIAILCWNLIIAYMFVLVPDGPGRNKSAEILMTFSAALAVAAYFDLKERD